MALLVVSHINDPGIIAHHIYYSLRHLFFNFKYQIKDANKYKTGGKPKDRVLSLIEMDLIESLYTSKTHLQSKIMSHIKRMIAEDFRNAKRKNKKYKGDILWANTMTSILSFTFIGLSNHYDYFRLKHSLDCYKKVKSVYHDNGDQIPYREFVNVVAPWKIDYRYTYVKNQAKGITDSTDIVIKKLQIMTDRISEIINSVEKNIHYLGDQFREYNSHRVPLTCKEMIQVNAENALLYVDIYNVVVKILWATLFDSIFKISLFHKMDMLLIDMRNLKEDVILEIMNIVILPNASNNETPVHLLYQFGKYEDILKGRDNMDMDNKLSKLVIDLAQLEVIKYMRNWSRIIKNKLFIHDDLPKTNLCLVQIVLDTLELLINIRDMPFFIDSHEYPLSRLTAIEGNREDEKKFWEQTFNERDDIITKDYNDSEKTIRRREKVPIEYLPSKTPVDTYKTYIAHLWNNNICKKLDNPVQLMYFQRLHQIVLKNTIDVSMEKLFALNIVTSEELDDPMKEGESFYLDKGEMGSILIEIVVHKSRSALNFFKSEEIIDGFNLYYISDPIYNSTKTRAYTLSTLKKNTILGTRVNAVQRLKSVLPKDVTDLRDLSSHISEFLFYPRTIKTVTVETLIGEPQDKVFIRFIKMMWILELMVYGIFAPGRGLYDFAVNIVHPDHEKLLKYYLGKLSGLNIKQ